MLKMYVNCLSSFLRSAKEHVLGLSGVSSAGDVEKADMSADDSVFEETIIAEYALVINGHSLVRYVTLFSIFLCSNYEFILCLFLFRY